VAANAAKDGTCGPVSAGTVCRAAAGPCDGAELCDGTSLLCPTDQGTGGDCGAPEPAAEPARDAAVADTPVGPELPPADPAPDASVAVEIGARDLGPDSPGDLGDAFVVADLATRDSAPPAEMLVPAASGKSGCGCRLGGTGSDAGPGVVGLFMLALALVRRARRR
jgi:MYXO-CTERM domain-containing protein